MTGNRSVALYSNEQLTAAMAKEEATSPMEHGLGFDVWDVDTPTMTPLHRKMGGKKSDPSTVLRVFLCRGSDQGQVAVASFHPDVFGPLGSPPWHAAIDYTIETFEGIFRAARPNVGLPVLLHVDTHDLPARLIGTNTSQLVVSAEATVPVAVIYSGDTAQPALATADWRAWRAI